MALSKGLGRQSFESEGALSSDDVTVTELQTHQSGGGQPLQTQFSRYSENANAVQSFVSIPHSKFLYFSKLLQKFTIKYRFN